MNGVEIASLFASVGADTGDFERKMNGVGSIIDGIGSTIGTFVKVGIGAAVTGLGAMAAGIGYSINKAADFSSTMSGAQAVLQATGDDMNKLSDLALQIGKDTKFSAQEAASSIEMLGQNGLTTAQILDGAAKATTDLAAATGTDLKTSADIASTAMSNFNIDAKDMAKAVDQMAGVTNASRLDMNDYAGAIAMAGGVAGSVGVSFEDFNAALASTAAAFSSGSDQGTSFKVFLQRLIPQSNAAADAMRSIGLFSGMTEKEMGKAEAKIQKYREQLAKLNPTSKNYTKQAAELNTKIAALTASLKTGSNAFFDSEGNMKSMTDIAARLNQSLSGLSDEERIDALTKIFGTDAQRFANALANAGAAGIQSALAIDANTKAADQAMTRMDNLAGDVEQFSGSLDTLAIKVGLAFGPLSRQVVQFFTGEINKLLELDYTGFAKSFEGYWQTVKSGLESGVELIKRLSSDYQNGGFGAVLGDLGATFEQWAANIWTVVSPHLSDLWSSLIAWVTDPSKQAALWKGVTATWDFAWKWAGYAWDAVLPKLGQLWSSLTGWVTDSAKRTQLWNSITSTWSGFSDWAGALWSGTSGKNGIQAKLTDLWSTVNTWLLNNYPQLKPWEDAFSTFSKSAREQWAKDFPDMATKFVKFRTDVGTELDKLKKNFADMWNTVFGSGGDAGKNGSGFVKALDDWATSVENRIVGILHTLNLVFEALNIGMKEWKAIMSGDFANAWELQMQYFNKLGEIGSYIGQGIVNNLPGRATGGSVQAGQTYMVGERGQELFTPSTNGYIYNANDTAAMMSGSTLRIEVAVTGESNLPMDRVKLRELARAMYNELRLSGAFIVTGAA